MILKLSDLTALESLRKESESQPLTNGQAGFTVARQKYEERLRELAPDMTEMCIRYLLQTGSKRI